MSPQPDWHPHIAPRIRASNEHAIVPTARYVLCWLQQTLRATDNPVIDAAIDLGNALGLPVLVYHGLGERYPHASARLHHFILHASRDLQINVTARGLRCITYVEHEKTREKGLVYRLAKEAAAVLTDDQPVFVARDQAARFAARCGTAVFAVDSARLVPTQALPKSIKTTPGFRKASGALRPEYEAHNVNFKTALPPYDGPLCYSDARLADKTDGEIETLIAACQIDHSLPPCPQFKPTEAAADAALATFVSDHLKTYPYRRNNAADESGVSRLSPYLHFGLIGPRTITAAVRAADVPANAKWKYLDELLTWREYFHYLAFHDPQADAFCSIPDRPKTITVGSRG